ncbi:MAG: DUF3365 domain-containing protein [Bacillota bacterium]
MPGSELRFIQRWLRTDKINPAFMTRLLSEMATKDLNMRFKITSLQPLNPQNAASQWKEEALNAGRTIYTRQGIKLHYHNEAEYEIRFEATVNQ